MYECNTQILLPLSTNQKGRMSVQALYSKPSLFYLAYPAPVMLQVTAFFACYVRWCIRSAVAVRQHLAPSLLFSANYVRYTSAQCVAGSCACYLPRGRENTAVTVVHQRLASHFVRGGCKVISIDSKSTTGIVCRKQPIHYPY